MRDPHLANESAQPERADSGGARSAPFLLYTSRRARQLLQACPCFAFSSCALVGRPRSGRTVSSAYSLWK